MKVNALVDNPTTRINKPESVQTRTIATELNVITKRRVYRVEDMCLGLASPLGRVIDNCYVPGSGSSGVENNRQ